MLLSFFVSPSFPPYLTCSVLENSDLTLKNSLAFLLPPSKDSSSYFDFEPLSESFENLTKSLSFVIVAFRSPMKSTLPPKVSTSGFKFSTLLLLEIEFPFFLPCSGVLVPDKNLKKFPKLLNGLVTSLTCRCGLVDKVSIKLVLKLNGL